MPFMYSPLEVYDDCLGDLCLIEMKNVLCCIIVTLLVHGVNSLFTV